MKSHCYVAYKNEIMTTLLHSERPKLYAILAFLSVIGLHTVLAILNMEWGWSRMTK